MRSKDRGGFGALLRAYRHEAGLTQEELAARAALSARTISDLERGVSQPCPRTVALLADALALTGTRDPTWMPTPWPRSPAAHPKTPAGSSICWGGST
jgi:transcriptional regulator with XRE-family HTH domain